MRHRTLTAIRATALIAGLGISAGTAMRRTELGVAAAAEKAAPADSIEKAEPSQRKPNSPEIRAKDIDGEDLSLHALLEKGPVLLDFWALWCRPCLKELPALDILHRKYAERGFSVIAVNADTPADVNRVKTFIRSRKYALRVITDLDGELRRRFQINAFPTAILLAPDGTQAWSSQGYRPGDEKRLEEKLLELLPGVPEAPPLRPPSGSR